MKFLFSVVVVLCITVTRVFSQEEIEKKLDKVDTKLDTVISNQSKIIEKTDKIYEEVRYDDPLLNKYVGVELNPSRALFYASEGTSITGSVSFFFIDRHGEIILPFNYTSRKEELTASIDLDYRRFIGKHQNGFFFCGGMKLLRRKGEVNSDWIFGNDGPNISATKLGAHFGLGFRYFAKSGFYWGTCIKMGTYLTDRDKQFKDDIPKEQYIDADLLKIGFSF